MKTILTLTLAVCSFASAQSTTGVTASPATLNFSYQIGATSLPAAQTLTITPTPKTLNFTIAVSGSPYNAAWLLVSASSGTGPTSIKVEVNPTGLAAGNYAGTITATAVTGGQTYTASTTVNLAVASAAATVTATPSSLNFTYTTGNPIPSSSLVYSVEQRRSAFGDAQRLRRNLAQCDAEREHLADRLAQHRHRHC